MEIEYSKFLQFQYCGPDNQLISGQDDIEKNEYVLMIYQKDLEDIKREYDRVLKQILKGQSVPKNDKTVNDYLNEGIERIYTARVLEEIREYSKTMAFLDYHFDKCTADKRDFIDFIEETVRHMYLRSDDHKYYGQMKRLEEWIRGKKKELKEGLNVFPDPTVKIKWNGTPSQFGYLFLELVKQGYIELPTYAGNGSYAALAKKCFESFDIKTTPDNLKKEMNPEKNSLSHSKQARFTIPNISELA